AADTNEKAQFLATTNYQRFLGIIRNQRVALMPPTKDMDNIWSSGEKELVLSKLKTSVIGDKAAVAAGLQKLIDKTEADELIIMSDAYDFNDRKQTYEIIAEAKGDVQSPDLTV
ncbi:MAG: LLM class flavin-dependent oxidoreductase, partial [Bdellovibrionaceae bacterium]|nr:LLM class flavin-dependent oxidoreductase [Pseudobdellovibrionaceae bacterium]